MVRDPGRKRSDVRFPRGGSTGCDVFATLDNVRTIVEFIPHHLTVKTATPLKHMART